MIQTNETAAHEHAHTETPRRSFLGWLLGLGTLGTGAVLSIPIVRYLLSPLSAKQPNLWSDVGPMDHFQNLTAPKAQNITVVRRDGWQESRIQQMVYVLPSAPGDTPRVLSSICPHLGCSVSWSDGLFRCPCHGGVFSPRGELKDGPPRRSMDSLQARIMQGRLQVKFEYFRPLLPNKVILG